MRTGDLGFQQDGELYITGRIKDIIIVRGQNHYPSDLEATLNCTNKQWLRENCTAIFTVKKQDTNRLVAVAEIQRSQIRHYTSDRAKVLIAKARNVISEQHGLQLFDLVLIRPGTLPKTSSGKIQRTLCRRRYEDGSLQRVIALVPEMS